MSRMRLTHVNLTLPAGAEDAAREFYCGQRGFREIPKPDELRARGGLWLDAGGSEIHLSVDPTGVDDRQRHIGLESSDIDGVRRELAAAGTPIDPGRPAPCNRFFVRDPFGNRIEIHEPGALRG